MKMIKLFITLLITTWLSACVHSTLKAPCPHFGAHCRKIPINTWDYTQVERSA